MGSESRARTQTGLRSKVLTCLKYLTVIFMSAVMLEAYCASSTDAVQAAKIASNEDEYLGALVSVRYFKKVSADDVVTLRAIWNSEVNDFKSSELSRNLLAEQLYRFDPSNQSEYLRYIIERTKSQDEEVRAESLFTLGFLRVDETQPALLEAVKTGTAKEAENAGYGLILFEQPDVYQRLCAALSARNTEDAASKRVADYLWSRGKWRC